MDQARTVLALLLDPATLRAARVRSGECDAEPVKRMDLLGGSVDRKISMRRIRTEAPLLNDAASLNLMKSKPTR